MRRALWIPMLAMAVACKASDGGNSTVALANEGSGTATEVVEDAATALAREHAATAAAERVAETAALFADQLFANSLKPDYALPVERSYQRVPVLKAYAAACLLGSHRACWIAADLKTNGFQHPQLVELVLTEVDRHCAAGDQLSCRTLRATSDHLDGRFGEYGRYGKCGVGEARCTVDDLRRECRVGYPLSCIGLLDAKIDDAERTKVRAEAKQLARAGCQQSVVRDCEILQRLADTKEVADLGDRTLAAEQLCTLQLSRLDCVSRGVELGDPDPLKQRAALERACQLSGEINDPQLACEPLWRAYTRTSPPPLPEPVPGRAKKLRNWACREARESCW